VPELISLIKRKEAFNTRTGQYFHLGYDRFAAAEFIINAGGKLNGLALDIGTGKGLTAMALARNGLDVISIDINPEEQNLARFLVKESGLDKQIQFLCKDASALPYSDGYFGCGAMVDVLHHLETADPVLTETARVLAPLGVLIIADFTAEGFDIVARLHRENEHHHAVSGVTMDMAESFLCRKGFEPARRLAGHMHDVRILIKKEDEKR